VRDERPIRVFAASFWTQKEGNTPEEFEDAFAPTRVVDCGDPVGARFAVADGATETSFSALWARTLVRLHHRVGLTERTLLEDLGRWQAYWRSRVDTRELPWYAEEKARRGAFAAVVGLCICGPAGDDPRVLRWDAVAVGDSCVFLVRDDRLRVSFPLSSSAQFGNRPVLVSSIRAANARLGEHIRRVDGDCRAADTFYLMTDAIACWFLRETEAGGCPWVTLREFGTEDEERPFPDWVRALRESGVLRNDDVAVLRVDLI